MKYLRPLVIVSGYILVILLVIAALVYYSDYLYLML